MAPKLKQTIHRSAGPRGTNVGGIPEKGIRVHEFRRTLKGAPQVIPEPIDLDTIVGVYGELFWYWPVEKQDREKMLLRKIGVEDLIALPDDIEVEIQACVEHYLKGFGDREPSDSRVREAYDEWKHGSPTTKRILEVLDYIIETHQIEE